MWQFMLFPGLLLFSITILGLFALKYFEAALKDENRGSGVKVLLTILLFSAMFASCASSSVLIDGYYTLHGVLP